MTPSRRASSRLLLAGSLAIVLLASLRVAPLTPASQGQAGRWFKGNTHTHTTESDGDSSPDDVVEVVPDARLQLPRAVAITTS